MAARVKADVIAADERSDGMFPLITNCQDLSLRQILEAYKFQPRLEKRHEQLKSVQHLAPVWLKNISRIEAVLFLYFVALLVHALLEREVRQGMAREHLTHLPRYPEERDCTAPSTERILDVFAPLQRHRLRRGGRLVQVFEPEQAAVVRRIFELCAAGLGVTRIAKLLNAEHAPPPRTARGWAPAAIREMLYRPLYRGELVWSRSQKIDRGGTKKRRQRPEPAWLRLEAPELRIVPDPLWRDAHARLDRARRAFGGGPRGAAAHPCRLEYDADSPYLLTGLGRCFGCGGRSSP